MKNIENVHFAKKITFLYDLFCFIRKFVPKMKIVCFIYQRKEYFHITSSCEARCHSFVDLYSL